MILNHVLNLLHHELADGTLGRITHAPHILSTQPAKAQTLMCIFSFNDVKLILQPCIPIHASAPANHNWPFLMMIFKNGKIYSVPTLPTAGFSSLIAGNVLAGMDLAGISFSMRTDSSPEEQKPER